MRLFLGFLSVCALLAAAGAAMGGYAVNRYLSPGPLAEEKIVLVEKGSGVSTIAQKLQAEGVINEPLIFKLAARITGKHGSLKAGEYQFETGIPMASVLDKMHAGETFDRAITIPEGLTSWQIVQRLNALDNMTGEITTIPPEGSLLPDTYDYIAGEDRNAKVAEMQAAMTRTIDELWEKRAGDLPFSTKEEALVLASIVEKETGVPEERHRVAGVFVNRLRQNMPLQTDPTVIYAITKGQIQDAGQGPLGRRLLSKDLEFDSSYNTYKNAGLPPGPIANPGRASIEATLNPEQHGYIYFVADGRGGHVFAQTLDEHNANVAKWRKIRREQNQ